MSDVMDAPALHFEALKEGPGDAAWHALLGKSPASVTLERTHFFGIRPAKLQYCVRLSSGETARLLAEYVPADPSDHAAKVRASLGKSRNGQKFGLRGNDIVSCEMSGLVLRRPGLDERLPGLRLFYDAGFARYVVARLCGHDPGPVVVQLMAHRLGKRAVLAIIGPGDTVYARLRAIKSVDGATRYGRHLGLWQVLGAGARLRIPEPLGEASDLGLSLFSSLPGEPPDFSHPDSAGPVAQGLAELRNLTLGGLPAHFGADEARLLGDWRLRCQHFLPDLAYRLAPHIQQVSERLTTLTAKARPCHRDLHEKQILTAQGIMGLLDFDTLSLADPALDPGNLLAHLFLAGHPEEALRQALDLPGIGLWRKAALLRLGMIYAFTSMPDAALERLITEACRDDRD